MRNLSWVLVALAALASQAYAEPRVPEGPPRPEACKPGEGECSKMPAVGVVNRDNDFVMRYNAARTKLDEQITARNELQKDFNAKKKTLEELTPVVKTAADNLTEALKAVSECEKSRSLADKALNTFSPIGGKDCDSENDKRKAYEIVFNDLKAKYDKAVTELKDAAKKLKEADDALFGKDKNLASASAATKDDSKTPFENLSSQGLISDGAAGSPGSTLGEMQQIAKERNDYVNEQVGNEPNRAVLQKCCAKANFDEGLATTRGDAGLPPEPTKDGDKDPNAGGTATDPDSVFGEGQGLPAGQRHQGGTIKGGTYTVDKGDGGEGLWGIARATLPQGASDVEINERMLKLQKYVANQTGRGDIIYPGQAINVDEALKG